MKSELKSLNALGQTYKQATDSQKRFFRAELARQSEQHGLNFQQSYSQTWQYTKKLGRLPNPILQAAIEHLDYKPLIVNPSEKMLATLKMA